MKVEETYKTTAVQPERWRHLCELAAQVRALAPWEWLLETDLFGIEMPGTRDTVFVSVMGNRGEHFAVAVYPGARAISQFWSIQNDEDVEPERIFEIPHVQLSFEGRDQLEPEERRVMKQLGLSFRGVNWPLFRS